VLHAHQLAAAQSLCALGADAGEYWKQAAQTLRQLKRARLPWLAAEAEAEAASSDGALQDAWEDAFGGAMDDPAMQARIDATAAALLAARAPAAPPPKRRGAPAPTED
jgi:hypothetical protein